MLRIILIFVIFLVLFIYKINAKELNESDSLSQNTFISENLILAKKVSTDTIVVRKIWSQNSYVKQSIAPFSFAASSLFILAFPNLKYRIQERLNWDKNEKVILYDDYLRYAPIGVGAILSLCGVKSSHPLLHQIGLIGVSYIVADFVVYRTKLATKIKRPNSPNEDSFPSQHTSVAFLAATVLHHEMGNESPWISIGGYATAAWVGYARIARNRHYASDVLMGAAVGTFFTNITYWTYDAISPNFKKNICITPLIQSNQFEMQLSFNF